MHIDASLLATKMQPNGLEKASDRLRKMQNAVENLRNSKDWQSSSDSWASFLMAAGSFYSVLQQASKDNKKSRAWYELRKHARRKDPLLRYIHHARNTEDHGCQHVVERASSQVSLQPGASLTLRSDGTNWIAENIEGIVQFANDTIRPVQVRDDRFGDVFDPPTHHLGDALQNLSALHIAELATAYFREMLSDAAALAQ